jgi:5'-nucleotidase / UDP-sugar diphosphatase
MGRETKLLLGLLALLAGVFMGLLSMKLLMPRPPAGTGPDIHADVAVASEPHDLVAPPDLEPGVTVPRSDVAHSSDDRYVGRTVGFEAAVTENAAGPAVRPLEPASFAVPPIDAPPPAVAPSPTASPVGATYVAREGDSWWSLAERAYGDGRLYRALFAWNRVLDPRVSLVPGTSIEIPALERLQAAWPTLLPAP